MLIQYFTKVLNRFSSNLVVVFFIVSLPQNGFAASSILVYGGQTDESPITRPNAESTFSATSDIDLVIRDVSLQDLLPSLSAVTGTSFRTDGRLNYKIEKFSFSGKPDDLLTKITTILPVGYYGDGENYDFYS